MKKTILVLGCMLFVLVIMLPFGVLVSSGFGYAFELASYSVYAIFTALLSVSIVVLSIVAKENVELGILRVLFSLLTPLSLINVVFYILKCSRIEVIVSVLICASCCCYLSIKHGKPVELKIITLILSALMVMPVGLFSFMALIFGGIGQNTVVRTVTSPNGAYYAEVIDSDQGALGGDTLVVVYENKGIDVFVFNITKKSQRIYRGEWGEFENMEIYWKSDSCLIINSDEYIIE